MSTETRVGILISGRGSNMISLLDAMQRPGFPARAALVLSNVPDAGGLERAADRGVPTEVVDHTLVRPRRVHEARVIEVLREHEVEVVCLAGYMRLLTPAMIEAFPSRILNIHPSLLPSFPGLHAQRQALEYGVRVSGCTVHLVDEQTDHGPILMQAAVPVEPDDTESDLAERILHQEHRVYPEALRRFVSGEFRIDGRVARVARAG